MNDRLEKIAEDMATPDGLVDFADYGTVRNGILESARKSVEESFPVTNDRYGVRLTNTRYVGPEVYTKKDQKDALMHHKSLTRRMVGDWQVYDSVSGKPIGDLKSTTVMHVPWLTDRGTFIRNGVDMVPIKQLRLNSSIYTRKTEDGHVESQFNPVARKGRAFRTFMDPKTSHFFMRYKNRKVPLYPVLKAMGVKDDEIKKTWGEEILEANRTLERSPYAINWLKQFSEAPQQQKQATINVEPVVPEHEILKQNLLTEFTAIQMDPDNTHATTGKRFDRVTPEALLTSSDRILKVHRGKEDTDDRDSLQFQGLYDYSDYLAEAIKNDHDGVARKLLWKITGKNGDIGAIQPGHLNKYADYLYNTSLLQGPEEISPIDAYDQNQRVTRLGPGAMSSLDVVPMEARAVQPSYLGYIDPVRAPECYVAGMEVLTSAGWIKWADATADHEFACKVDDLTLFEKPVRVMSYYVSEDVYTYDDPDIAYAVTHNHRMWAGAGRRKSSFEIMDARTAHMRYLTMDIGLHDFHSCELVPPGYGVSKYTGTVYCAEVTGGLLYVRTPGRKGFWCGNSMKVGVDMKFARGVRKGPGNQMYTSMVDPKTGQKRWVSARRAAASVVALPDMLKTDDQFVPAVDGKGVMGYVDRDTVDYVVPSGGDMFSNNSNMVPMLGGIKGMRLLMAAKHFSSALPLVNRESPLVITTAEDGSANEDAMSGIAGAVRAEKPGTVKQVRKDGILVANADGTETKYDVYDNFPYARSTYIRNTPSVKAGDKVDKNGLLATSNYTDDKGRFSGGVNLNTAFMNYHGYNYEDGVAMSESAAEKMTSEHMFTERLDDNDDLIMDKKKYATLFPGRFDKKQLATIGDDGVVKPGTVLDYGDPMFLSYKHVPPSPGNAGRRVNQEAGKVWDHNYPAVVTDAGRGRKGWQVLVRSNQPMQVGDKLNGRYGNKGTVAKIIPDAQMPTDENGQRIDLLLNANGIPTRTNPSQAIEMALAKYARATGKPIQVDSFDDVEDLQDKAQRLLDEVGLKDRETIHDPILGKKIPKVYTGPMYIFKQSHTSDKGGKARSTAAYTAEGLPAKGGSSGSKHYGSMEQESLLAYGAEGLLKDIKLVKGQRNDNFWRDMRAGRTPTIPDSPYVYDKFRELLKGAGINLREEKDADHIFAMTNDQVKEMTGTRKLQSGSTFRAVDMQPIAGGLFDPEIIGSNGKLWGYVDLPEPMLNPISEDPIRSLLDIRKSDLEDLMTGRTAVGGKRGGHGLKAALEQLNTKTIKKESLEAIKEGSKSKRDAAVKRYSYAHAMEEAGVQPKDLMWDRVPVLPPTYRPITNMNGMNMVADPNYMYKALIDGIEDYRDAADAGVGEEAMQEARKTMVDNVRALIGTADPVQEKLQQKNVGGILAQIVGKGSPKHSLIQRRLLGTNIDIAGQAVITPNPALKLDQVGLPERQAWDLYEPYIVRELVRRGHKTQAASDLVERKSKPAYEALKQVITERPIIYNRAPTLHKYSIMGAWPVLTKGSSLQIHPAVVTPFNADFDGDKMSFTVPTTQEAVQDVIEKMMPGKSLLLSERDDRPLFQLQNEYVQGLWAATKKPRRTATKKFATIADAKKAYAKGEIQVDDPIVIENRR